MHSLNGFLGLGFLSHSHRLHHHHPRPAAVARRPWGGESEAIVRSRTIPSHILTSSPSVIPLRDRRWWRMVRMCREWARYGTLFVSLLSFSILSVLIIYTSSNKVPWSGYKVKRSIRLSITSFVPFHLSISSLYPSFLSLRSFGRRMTSEKDRERILI